MAKWGQIPPGTRNYLYLCRLPIRSTASVRGSQIAYQLVAVVYILNPAQKFLGFVYIYWRHSDKKSVAVEVSGMVYNLFHDSLYECDLIAKISLYESWRPVQGRMANKAQSWST